jgi:hypothetical protein
MSNIETFVERQVKAVLAAAGVMPYGTVELKFTIHERRIVKADQIIVRSMIARPTDEEEGEDE